MPRIVITGAGSPDDDHRPLIQRALDAVEADGGGVVYIPDGKHYIGPPGGGGSPSPGAYSLQLGNNVHLALGRGATLVRRFADNDEVDATIRNKDQTNGNSNIRVSGGTLTTDDPQNTGKHLGFVKTNFLRVDGLRITGVYGAWNTMFRDCHDVELRDCVIDSPQNANQHCLLVGEKGECRNIRILGGAYRNATHYGITLGVPAAPPEPAHAVIGFEISGALIEGAALYGLQVQNASEGIVVGNKITGSGFWGIVEALPSDNNLYIANRLNGNPSGGLQMTGPNSEGIRNVVDAGKPTADSGGFRQTIDGWSIATGTASGAEMTRFAAAPPAGRYRAARAGSITGLVLESTVAMSGGTVTAEVYRNTGTPDAAPAPANATGYQVTLSAGDRITSTQPIGTTVFGPGAELYVVFTKTGTPIAATLRCSFELEI